MHPHLHGDFGPNNTLYISRATLDLGAGSSGVPGGGLWGTLRDDLVLTAPGENRTIWQLPRWFMPLEGRAPLSYHESQSRWHQNEASCILRSAARGQEFVLDTVAYPEAVGWAQQITTQVSSQGYGSI